MSAVPTVELDERGMLCPHPIIELGKLVRARDGKPVRIVLLADDIATRADVPAWCRMTDAQLIAVAELSDGSGLRFEILA